MKKEKFHYEDKRYVDKITTWQEKGLKKYLINYVDFVRRYVKPGAKYLDLGCGAGLSSDMLSRYYNVTGADYSQPVLDYAKKHFKNPKFKREDARKLSFKDNSFDAVCACGFIEHVKEVDKVLSEMHRVVKKKGVIIIVSPNWFTPLRAIRAFISNKGYETIGRNRIQIIGWFFKSVYYTIQKLINPAYVFRNPDISNEKLVGNDIDMVYIANPYDLKRFFEKKGFKRY
jgi:ubiquinone/menaquinone biosynthesis C-methylase UbiE|tara:strand:- start:28 stop:714 length:687 start_codon:yes stop_codon:yes gene_type:complete